MVLSSRIDFVGYPSLLLISFPVLFRITVLFCFVCLFLMLSLLDLVCGSSMFLSSRKEEIIA